MKRVFLIVLDSCGIGQMPDCEKFGDIGVNTLRSCSTSRKFSIPNLLKAGIGNIDGVDYLPKAEQPQGAYARLTEASMGKDTTIGHWEIAGVVSPEPCPPSRRASLRRCWRNLRSRPAGVYCATSPIPARM